MAARTKLTMGLLVISLVAAVISLPMMATAAVAPNVKTLNPVTQTVKAPIRIAMSNDGSGGFYVTDPRNNGVLRYDASGALLQVIKTAGVPQGVAVGTDGNLVVSQGTFVAILDKVTGLEVKRLTGAPVPFSFSDGIAVDDVGSIYITDQKANTVTKFDSSGNYLLQFGSYGSGNGQFSLPAGIAYEKVGQLIAVADAMNGRVQFFNKSGVYQKSIGSYGGGALKFTTVMGVAFDYTSGGTVLNRMYAVDAFQSSVQTIDPAGTGTFLLFIGDYGSANGQLMVPSDVAFDQTNNRLLVANGYGNVTIYGIDGGTTPGSGGVTPPTLSVNAPLSIVNVPNITLNGTVTGAGVSVSCALNGSSVFPATVATGSWSCSVTGLQADNTIVVTARNTSPVSASQTFNIKYLPSGPSLGVNAIAPYVNSSPITITGSVDAGSTVQANNLTNSTSAGCTVNGTTYSCSLNVVTGANSINVVGTHGGTTTAGPYSTVFDNTPPVVNLSAVADTAVVNGQVLNVTGTVQDANLSGVTVNGKPVTVTNGVFSAAVVGATTLNVVATDLAGNVTTVTPRTVSYDSSKAKISVTSPADGASVISAAQTISGTLDKSVASLSVGAVAATINGTSWSASVNLNTGMNDLQIVASDGGRTKLTLFYDATKPAIAATVTPDHITKDIATNQATISVTATVDPNVTLMSSVNGSVEQTQASGVPFAVSLPTEGSYPVLLVADDGNGNKSYTVRTIVYDITPPALSVATPTNPTTTLSGTVETGAAVVVKDITSLMTISTATVTNGTWTAALGGSYNPFTLTVAATDAAGNTTYTAPFKPDGDITVDGVVDLNDVRYCMSKVVGLGAVATPVELAHGDIGPLSNGIASPNGKIDISDCLLINRKVAGLPVTW